MQLYGQRWTRRELEARIGRLEQVGGVRRLQWTEGSEFGVEQIQVRTGAGLAYYVTPTRGLDISLAEFGGVPLSWQSPNGDVHPMYYDAKGMEWLRTAVGGLLMTCGLTQVGSPCRDGEHELGLHGRAHHLPARHLVAEGHWIGDEYEMRVGGVIEETAIFGEYVRLTREIRSRLGENRIVLKDVVENAGFDVTPHMLLYHCNFGFPLLCEETTIEFPSRRVVPRDEGTPISGYDSWQAPVLGYRERVYYHEDIIIDEVLSNQNAKASVVIRNPRFPLSSGAGTCPLAVRVTWSTTHLPRLVQWKMPGAGVHVLGIEPANCHVEGRVAERERGTLVKLQPGETLTYQLEVEVSVQ
jgi:Domain of unknown function (DUF4432)